MRAKAITIRLDGSSLAYQIDDQEAGPIATVADLHHILMRHPSAAVHVNLPQKITSRQIPCIPGYIASHPDELGRIKKELQMDYDPVAILYATCGGAYIYAYATTDVYPHTPHAEWHRVL